MADEKYVECMPIVEELYNKGVPVKEIAKRCGNSVSTVYNALKRLEEMGRVKRRRGRYKSRGRLTQEEVERILELYAEGYSLYQIAKSLGRPVSTVYNVLRRKGVLQ